MIGKKSKAWLIIGACVMAIVIVVMAVTSTAANGNEGGDADGEGLTVVLVDAKQPQTGDLVVSGEFIGRIEPELQVTIIPKAAGEVLATYFEVGDRVEAGDLLFEMDPTGAELQLMAAQAAYDAATASAEQATGGSLDAQEIQAESGYESAKSGLSSAEKLLKLTDENLEDQIETLRSARNDAKDGYESAEAKLKEYNNQGYGQKIYALQQEIKALQEQLDAIEKNPSLGSSSGLYTMLIAKQNELEGYSSAYSTAAAAVNQTEAAYKSARNGYEQAYSGRNVNISQIQSQVSSAKLSVEAAEKSLKNLNEKVIPQARAAASAQLAQAQVQIASAEYQLSFAKVTAPISGVIESKGVTQYNMASQQSPAYIISNKDMMTVSFNVSETVRDSLSTGDRIAIEKGEKSYTGEVIEVPTMVDMNTGLFKIKASVSAPGSSLLTGTTVKIRADVQKAENAVLVPIDAVYYENSEPFVYVVRDGIARKTAVETGISGEENIQILSGVRKDDTVITTWHVHLADGVAVTLAGSEQAGEEDASSDGEAV